MTAIEVLEWLKKHNHNGSDEVFYEISDEELCVCDLLYEYSPQTIINRIEKYETKKSEKEVDWQDLEDCKDRPNYDAFTDECEINGNCHLAYQDEEQDFKVGDWVKHKNGNKVLRIAKIDDKGIYLDSDDDFVATIPFYPDGFELAEPPKEEVSVECIHAIASNECEWLNSPSCSDCSHFTPRAEKQKIEKPQLVNVGGGEAETLMNCWRTINQLVDAVNELRGV